MALTGSGNDPNQQAQSQAPAQTRTQLNQQKQRQYGAKNGMGAANAAQAQSAPQAAPNSPVTATGQINAQAQAPAQPQWSGGNVGQQALDWTINHPTLSNQVTAQMKGTLQDQAAQMAQGNRAQIAQAAAGRGLSGGGWQGQQEAQTQQALQSGLLGGYRDIDIQSADMNRKNLLASLGVDAQNFNTRANILGTMMGRANNMDQTGLGYAQLNSAQQQALWRSILGTGA